MQTDHLCGSRIYSEALEALSGRIDYPLFNDAVFRITMERKPMVILRGFLSSLLDMPKEEITDVQIRNPVDLRKVKGKEVILDVKVEVNHEAFIDIEFQMYYDRDWKKRSILYLSRTFDNVSAGEGYGKIRSARHIGIVDRSLFPEEPEFYSSFQILNLRTHRPYSTDFSLNVMDVSHLHLATEEDRVSGRDRWARMFLAESWEALRDAAAGDESLQEAAESMAMTNLLDEEREIAEGQAKYRRLLKQRDLILEAQEAKLREKNDLLEAQEAKLKEVDDLLEVQEAKLKKADELLKARESKLEETQGQLNEMSEKLAREQLQSSEKDRIIEELRKRLRDGG